MKKRVVGLDYLRAVSMVLVVLYHYTTRYQEVIGHAAAWTVNFPWGCFAVNTFFVLTGYLTFLNLKYGGVQFLTKRLIRLYPTFWVCILITSAFMAFWMPERLCSVRDIFLNLTMFPGLFGASKVDGVYWTLQVEMFFYLLVSVISIQKFRQWRNAAVGVWIGVATIAFLCSKNEMNSFVLKLLGILTLANSRFEFLAAGVLLAMLQKEQNNRRLLPCVGMLVCGIVAYMDMGWLDGLLWLVLTVAAILFAVTRSGEPIGKWRHLSIILTWLAQISYPVYLTHQMIGFAILRRLDTLGMTSEIFVVIPILFGLALGTLLNQYVELPITQFLMKQKNFIDGRYRE